MSNLTFLLLMLWAGVTVSTMVDLQKRIFNGKDCDKKERLYHVSLSEKSDGKPGYCGGSLISKQWILTAAHCKKNTMYAVVGVHAGRVRAEKIDNKDIIPHEHDDIMLLKLPKAVNDIDPVALPTCKDKNNKLNTKPQEGDEVQLAGHGYYKIDSKTKKPVKPAHLQCALFYVGDCDNTSVDDCYSVKPYNAPKENRVCYEETGVHPAEGDSGGGVIYDKKIYAVHIAGTRICAKLTKGVSLRVCSYIDWINENIKK